MKNLEALLFVIFLFFWWKQADIKACFFGRVECSFPGVRFDLMEFEKKNSERIKNFCKEILLIKIG